MSTETISRSASLDQIASALRGDEELQPKRKQELLSALNSVGRVLGLPLSLLPSDPRQLGPRLAGVAPAAHGMSEGRWNNVRSLVGKAVATAHPFLPGRQDNDLLPDWEALLDEVAPRYQQAAISAGLRWLSGRGIGPEAVTVDALEEFLAALRTRSLRAKPEDVCRRFVKGWNYAQKTVPGWPAVTLTCESRKVVCSLPWEDLPASFKADADCWFARQSHEDLFAEDGPTKPLKPITLKSYEQLLRTCSWALVQAGIPADQIRFLADLVTLPHFRLILQDLWTRTGGQRTATLARRADVLISIARHYVGVDDAALAELRKAAKRVTPEVSGMTQKNRDRLRPFDNPETLSALATLPFRMREEVERSKAKPVRAAQKAEMAVAIAVLLVAPVRMKNLRMIEIGKQLRMHGRRMMLSFVEGEVKNAVPLEFEIDPETADLITWFIEHHRPLLAPEGCAFLFPGRNGGARTDCGLSVPLGKAVHKGLGLDVNPHLFRHLAAKLFLDANPGQYETVRQFLGHRTIVTTMRFYAGFETKTATRLYRGVVEGLRKKEPAK